MSVLHEVETVPDGVWVHANHPHTGKLVSVYINTDGSSDGLIIDIWREGADAPVESFAVEWNELGGEL